jgi:hypothetical protein
MKLSYAVIKDIITELNLLILSGGSLGHFRLDVNCEMSKCPMSNVTSIRQAISLLDFWVSRIRICIQSKNGNSVFFRRVTLVPCSNRCVVLNAQ